MVLRARRLFAFLTLLALVAGAIGRASVAWTCEGRVCSLSLARCCCASPEEKRDGSCLVSREDSGGACEGRCSCTAVVDAPDRAEALRTASFVPAWDEIPLLLPLPLAPESPGYVSLETPQVRAIPPPADRLPIPPCLAQAAPRAPPLPV